MGHTTLDRIEEGLAEPRGNPFDTPPTESRSADAVRTTSSKRAGSLQPPISVRRVVKRTLSGSIFLATTPAATSATVSRAEKWPPPRGSLQPSNFR